MTQGDAGTTANQNGVEQTLTRNGGLSYLEISAADPEKSATFYADVFNWAIDRRGHDDLRFRDATGHLIGRWVKRQQTSPASGFLPYFYVDAIDGAVERVVAQRGEVVRAPYREGNLWIATVRDPAGNLIGLWQDGAR